MVLSLFKKHLLVQLGITAGVITMFAAFILFLNADINGRIEQINGYKNNLLLREKTIEVLSAAHGDLEKAQTAFSVLDNIMPSRDSLVNLPRELEKIGKNYSLTVGFNFEDESSAVADEPGFIHFGMSLLGPSYTNILGFLKEMEAHRYFIGVENITIQPREEGDFQALVSGKIFTK